MLPNIIPIGTLVGVKDGSGASFTGRVIGQRLNEESGIYHHLVQQDRLYDCVHGGEGYLNVVNRQEMTTASVLVLGYSHYAAHQAVEAARFGCF